jgi:hypothetical protein
MRQGSAPRPGGGQSSTPGATGRDVDKGGTNPSSEKRPLKSDDKSGMPKGDSANPEGEDEE